MESISHLFVANSVDEDNSQEIYYELIKALTTEDHPTLIEIFNEYLAKFPYDKYNASFSEKNTDKHNFETIKYPYRSILLTLFHASELNVIEEKNVITEKTDITVNLWKKIMIIDFKICRKGDNEKKLLIDACDQIKDKCSSTSYKNPICLGIVITDEKRAVADWKAF
jgi:hypothetical protein